MLVELQDKGPFAVIFINYAREDRVIAARISNELEAAGVAHWIDVKSLQPGQDWKREIRQALRGSDYIMLLLSSHSVSKRGYVQREIKEAIDLSAELPRGEVFLLPVRIDDCQPRDDELAALNWVDLFPDPDLRLQFLVKDLKALTDTAPARPETRADAAEPRPYEVHLAPYKSFGEVMRMFFSTFPRTRAASSEIAYFISVATQAPGVVLPEPIRDRFPEVTVLVLQHQYADLRVDSEKMVVDLWFHGEKFEVTVPHEAIASVTCQGLDFEIRRGPQNAFYETEGLKRRIAELEADLARVKNRSWLGRLGKSD